MTELTPYHEDQELDNNTSDNTHFRDILEQHITRRSLIAKTASGAAALALASTYKIKVAILDFDLQFGDVCHYLQLEPEKTIFDAQQAIATKHSFQFHLIPFFGLRSKIPGVIFQD